jgi:TPR repeat protein
MIRRHPVFRTIAAMISLSLSAAPVVYSQQAGQSFPDNASASGDTYQVKLCVPGDLVDRDEFEQPSPGSKMDAFHTALRNYLRDHGDYRREYQVKGNAFAAFDPANADPRTLLDEVSADASCPSADYSYNLPVKRVGQDAAPAASPGAAQPPSSTDTLYRGWQYQMGQGVPKDAAVAARLYADAANQGNPDAMYRLALLYRDGNGIGQDSAAAANWFYQAAKQGHAAAQMELGFACITGNGVHLDNVAGFRWLQLAAQAGLARAQAALGAMYQTGRGLAQNDPEASVWFRRAAEQGQPVAMFELGQSLRLARGVLRDEAQAMQWYQKSAGAGYVQAQAQLGFGYLTGSGAARDYGLAAQWLTEAARQGEPYAQLNLGTMYEDGSGVDRNLAQARALYVQAASSPEPKVAERARQFLAELPDSRDDALPGHATQSSNTNAVFGVAALAVGAAMLLTLLNHSGSDDTAATAPPSPWSPWMGSPISETTSTSRPAPPPAPHCHMAPVEDPFTIKPGLYTPHGGSTLVCD